MEICPARKKSKGKFPGPLYLLDVARLFFDPRDKADRRLEAVTEGIEWCDGYKKCNEVCPVNLDVFEMAVGGLKRQIKLERRTSKRRAKRYNRESIVETEVPPPVHRSLTKEENLGRLSVLQRQEQEPAQL